MHVREAMVAPAMTKGQSLMIDSHLMQNRRMDVVNIEWILHNRVSKLICLSERKAAAETATSYKKGVTIDMMIPTTSLFDRRRVGGASHLSRP